MTLIRDLIEIPTQVQDGDFVLKLTQGVSGEEARRTIDSYVVTPQLAGAFDQALGLIASAVQDRESKAAYLQGSFGSGKSHFMAMLHLLLSHDVHARSKRELHAALEKWDPILQGKRFLLVPVHFLDARSMEQKILGGYVERVQALHPEGGVPAVFLGDAIISSELPNLRASFDDEAILRRLNEATGAGDEWGQYGTSWTVERLEEALAAPATHHLNQELVAAYIAAFRAGTSLEAANTGEGFVDLDHGLAAISAHAKKLGYDGIVLFLDELILWLAASIGRLDFVQRESQKLTKLVEATAAARPVPIVSFVARQRDLRDLVGSHIAGEQQQSFADNLELQQGRFGRIELASGNLPVVARQRLLRPLDEQAEAQLRHAVDAALAGRDDVRRTLLGRDADVEVFRTVYPFSPALVSTLVDVAEALQRERTALKVMLQLLVDRRDDLELGQIIPVGDLWDVVAARDEPFANELRPLFETAKRLWRTKLLPALRAVYAITDETPADDPSRAALATDERLVKTILLAALVPEVEAFHNLDAATLAALNWGSITSPIPGQETQLVASKLRRLSTQVGELLVGDDPVNPTVALRLANVDTEEIIQRAQQDYDKTGTRRQKIRELISSALEDRISHDLRGTLTHEWRGTDRPFDVLFGNVRDTTEVPDHALGAAPDRPKIVIDFPFDDQGHGPDDDFDRLASWSTTHGSTNTVCWFPSFFNTQGLRALGRYVAVDELLKLDRFEQHTQHLSQTQRLEARPVLENTRTQLAAQLKQALLVAYGVIGGSDDLIDPVSSLTDHYRSLDDSLVVRPTTRPTMIGALRELCDQILAHQYPGHPRFDAKVTPGQLRTTWTEVRRALADPENRIIVESSHRAALRNVAVALELGTMGESHFNLGDRWRTALDRYLAGSRADGRPVTVEDVRTAIDDVPGGPRGLPPEIADLIVLTVAAQTDHRIVHGGTAVASDGGRALPGDAILQPEVLPGPEAWEIARTRASLVFGINVGRRVSGPELTSLAEQARGKAREHAASAARLVDELTRVYRAWGLDSGARLTTAQAALHLVESLKGADDNGVVDALVAAEVPSSERALAKSLSSAAGVAAALVGTNIELWKQARQSIDPDATDVLTADEIAQAYQPAERDIERRATIAIMKPTPPVDPIEPPPGPGEQSTPGTATGSMVTTKDNIDDLVSLLQSALSDHPFLTVTWQPTETP